MPKNYCTHCYKPTEYTNSRPQFCSHCGKNMSIITISSKTTESVEEDVDNGQEVESFDVDLLRKSVEVSSGKSMMTIGDVLNNPTEPVNHNRKKMSKKELADFQKSLKNEKVLGRAESVNIGGEE